MNKKIILTTIALILKLSGINLSAQCEVPAPTVSFVVLVDLSDSTGCGGSGGPADNAEYYVFYDNVTDTNDCSYWMGTKPKTCYNDTTYWYYGEHTDPYPSGSLQYEVLDFWVNDLSAQYECTIVREPDAYGSYSSCYSNSTRVTWYPGGSVATVYEDSWFGSGSWYTVPIYYN